MVWIQSNPPKAEWCDLKAGKTVRVVWIEHPRSEPAVWVADELNPHERAVNEVDDYYIILKIEWRNRDVPVEVVDFGVGEDVARWTLEELFGIS